MENGQSLAGYQRAALLRQAHSLSPVAMVGKQGATQSLVAHVDQELDNHELIKVRFSDFKDERRSLAEELSEQTGAILVAVLGHVAILYRAAEDPADRRISVPVRKT